MKRAGVAIGVGIALWLPSEALADSSHTTPARSKTFEDPQNRPLRFGVGAGGYIAATGPAGYGPCAELDVYPGGAFGRYGLRLAYRGFRDASPGLATAGITYEVGAARPRLVMALHADAGLTFTDMRPIASGGVHIQLAMVWPVALGLDTTATIIVDGSDSTVALTSALQLRFAH